MDRPVHDYASAVAHRVEDVLGDRLVGVWLVGSLALGDFQPGRSDIDVQAVADGPVPLARRRSLAERLAHDALPVPARGLEFVLYARQDLALPGGPRFALNLNSGPGMDSHVAFDADDDPGFWFTIDVDIARSSAVPLTGPPARGIFPALPRREVAAAVLEGLDWWTAKSGTPTQTLLSACRSWAWATDGRWRSKSDSARWARTRLADPAGVDAALRARAGEAGELPTPAQAEVVVALARWALRKAAG